VILPTADYSVALINAQLDAGKHLLFTPGVYDIDETILVKRPNTVVLGIGQAALTAVNGCIPLQLADQPGIIVAGITIDAGDVLSPVLLQVGATKSLDESLSETELDPTNPITLSDVYFRLGGPHVGKASIGLEVNSDHVLIDHIWVWRADHGIEGFDQTDGFEGDNERWATNIGVNGVVVNGNDVMATGLFVEHFQEYNLLWKGEGGRVFFFQNELPYEPASQEEWTTPDGTLGFAGYKVADDVTTHEMWSGGVYAYNRNNPDVVTANGFEVPNAEGVQMHRCYTRCLSGPGTILSVINGVGETADSVDPGPHYVVEYVDVEAELRSNPGITVIDLTWTTAQIQSIGDDIFEKQKNNEMGTDRYSLYFLPGIYGSEQEPLSLQVGYYTEIAGLGATPDQVEIYGKIEVYNRCFETDPYNQDGAFIPIKDGVDTADATCFALNSFWRSMANLSIQIVSKGSSCHDSAMFWAISQASSMRRVHVRGGTLTLMDYCSSKCTAMQCVQCLVIYTYSQRWCERVRGRV
jgi:hypothetical protein